MRLSESLKKNIIETTAGKILNKFKIKKRRNVLFFEDILAIYVKECEKAGFGKEMRNIAKRWMNLGVKKAVPDVIKKLPSTIFFNMILKNMWTNLGIMDDLKFLKKGSIITIKTKNETITRIIGKNDFSIGCFSGILNTLFNSEVRCVEALQSKKSSKYIFELKNEPFNTEGKNKEEYNRLNYLSKINGCTLTDALKNKIFQLKGKNRIYFRGKRLSIVENTIFHLTGNRGILLDKVPHISYDFFEQIIEKDSTDERKLVLLKTLLQTMGWGIIKISYRNKKIILIEIKNPPYGFQLEKDNWDFLIQAILGYFWLLDKDFKLVNIDSSYKQLNIIYHK